MTFFYSFPAFWAASLANLGWIFSPGRSRPPYTARKQVSEETMAQGRNEEKEDFLTS